MTAPNNWSKAFWARARVRIMKQAILNACMATEIPEAWNFQWNIRKYSLAKSIIIPLPHNRRGEHVAGTYTQLWRLNNKTENGELVMTDARHELLTHLDFMMRARGDVLITGLGLGCVLRGVLANPNVKTVTVIERDGWIINKVWECNPALYDYGRARVIQADALQWTARSKEVFDCAWHDLFSEPNEPHLQINHADLFGYMAGKVRLFQGAWAMPRAHRRAFRAVGKFL